MNYNSTLIQLSSEDNLRILHKESDFEGLINLNSNDYLALREDKKLKSDFFSTITFDSLNLLSSASSRLLSGNIKEYTDLESIIADSYKREAALIFNSGYHANSGVLPALTETGDLIIADKFVHASIIDGIRLSKATFQRFRHLDYEHLSNILSKCRSDFKNVFIVTETIFSMDGDIADLQKLLYIKDKYKCFLYADDAHALGVRGINGLGLCEEQNVIAHTDIIVGTFGKALSSLGGYIVCDEVIKQYLVNKSRSLIYTTALPAINLLWTKYVFERLRDFSYKRKVLENKQRHFHKLLHRNPQSHIISFIKGSNKSTQDLSEKLLLKGYFALPVRTPTVPNGTARIRISLNPLISDDNILNIIKILNNE